MHHDHFALSVSFCLFILFGANSKSLSVSNKGLLQQQQRSNTCMSICLISPRLKRDQSEAALAHLGHHSRSGVDLGGVGVGHCQVHYPRPGLCPHIPWKRTDDSAGESVSSGSLAVMRQELHCSAAVKPNWIWRCESVPSPAVWNCRALSCTSLLRGKI